MTYIKALLLVAISFVIVGCSNVKETILAKKDAVVLIINNDKGAIGTGFFINDDTIITNAHVIEGNKNIQIKTEHIPQLYDVEVINFDTFADVAVVKLKDWEKFAKENNYTTLQFAEGYNQLDDVYAIGHPWGLFWTISKGIVSSETRLNSAPKFLLQTDAHIFQGNSGGPLLDIHGNVIGMNSNMLANEGGSYGLAIPMSLIKKVLKDFEEYKEVRWAALGVSLDKNVIVNIDQEMAAAKAGVKVNDKVIAIETMDGNFQVLDADDLIIRMSVSNYKDPVKLFIERNDKIETIVIQPSYRTSDMLNNSLTEKAK